MPRMNHFDIRNRLHFNDFPNFDGNLLEGDENTLWEMRERLYYVLFARLATSYCLVIPAQFRKFIEFLILGFALILLFILFYVHASFVQLPVNCLAHVPKNWQRDGILRVEFNVSDYNSNLHDFDFLKKFLPAEQILWNGDRKSIVYHGKTNELLNNLTYFTGSSDFKETQLLLSLGKAGAFQNESIITDYTKKHTYPLPVSFREEQENPVWRQQKYIMEYTLEYGLLKLSPMIRKKLEIPILVVRLDPQDEECFGSVYSRYLLKRVVGFSDMLMSSIKNLVDKDKNKGFVRNIISGDQYKFINKTLTSTTYVIAAVSMVIFTLSISMLLRYSHRQIFLLIVHVLHALDFNINTRFPAASLLTVIFALVGMEAIMSHFFNDDTTAFYIIITVWVADQYDTICCYHNITKRYWPRFFYLFHFAFYAYSYRFNGQYNKLALLTSWMFIQHSMIYFFHRFELPYVLENIELTFENRISPPPPAPPNLRFLHRGSNSGLTRNSRTTSSASST